MKKLALVLAMSLCAAAAATAAPAEVKFDVLEYVVEGNTVLPEDIVERTLQPFMGPGRTFKDVDAAREALEKAFQDAGFLSVLVSLPNQRVDKGEIRLEVTEAKVEKLAITGSQYHLPSNIRKGVPSLASGSTPYFPQVQQELAAVQSGDVQVTPLISAGNQPDSITVELKVQDQFPLRGSIELNNRQSFNTSKGRLNASASYGNLFQAGHTIGASWQYAPWRPADTNVQSLFYALPVSKRDDLTVSLTNSDSDTPLTGASGNTITKGETVSLNWHRDLDPKGWPVRHGVNVAVDHKHNKDQTNIVEELSTAKPALRYALLTAGYELNWQIAENKTLDVDTTVSGSTHALAGRDVDCNGRQLDQFACKRSGASPDFLAWRTGLVYKGPLWRGWRVYLGGTLRLASGPLASGEQYMLGGPDSVRGYYDAEQAGDWGWQARAEVSTPAWFDWDGWKALGLVFYDRGQVRLIDPQEGKQAGAHLASAGLGWRLENGKGLLLSLDVAQPLISTQRAADSGGRTPATRRHSTHVQASIRQSF